MKHSVIGSHPFLTEIHPDWSGIPTRARQEASLGRIVVVPFPVWIRGQFPRVVPRLHHRHGQLAAFIEWRWLRTRDPIWRELYFFWQKIFAVSFGMGVVSGIVMAFQFGTNWSVLAERTGSIQGPLSTEGA